MEFQKPDCWNHRQEVEKNTGTEPVKHVIHEIYKTGRKKYTYTEPAKHVIHSIYTAGRKTQGQNLQNMSYMGFIKQV